MVYTHQFKIKDEGENSVIEQQITIKLYHQM